MDRRTPKTPYVSPELVTYLNAIFPDRCPSEADTDAQIKLAIGSRKVVDHLAALAQRQSADHVEVKL